MKTYRWRYPCTEAYYDERLGKIVCFCKNQSIKLVNIKKFTREENYLSEDVAKLSEPRLDDYIINCSNVNYGGAPAKWIFSKKGNVYQLDIGIEGKKKSIKQNKVLELNADMAQVSSLFEKNLILVTS